MNKAFKQKINLPQQNCGRLIFKEWDIGWLDQYPEKNIYILFEIAISKLQDFYPKSHIARYHLHQAFH